MIALASDHGGFRLKERIKAHLEEQGLQVQDFGTHSLDSCDYPLLGAAAAKSVASGTCARGILVCTTGIGISIAANKIPGIRAALCVNTTMARLTREHNDANMLSLGAGMLGEVLALEIVDTFLNTEFTGDRHQRRVDQITALEQ